MNDTTSTFPFALDADPLLDILRDGQLAIWRLLHHQLASDRQRMGFSTHQRGNTEYPSFARYGLPYGLTEIAPDAAILVNRDYKPVGIGMHYGRFVNYDAFPQWIIRGERLARAKAARCWLSDSAHPPSRADRFMFNDGCPPWGPIKDLREYARKLAVLVDTLAAATGERAVA